MKRKLIASAIAAATIMAIPAAASAATPRPKPLKWASVVEPLKKWR